MQKKEETLPNSVIWHFLYSSFQLLLPLVTAHRYDGPTKLAHSEPKILHEKIHYKSYSDYDIIRILTTRSKAQLLATFNYNNDAFGHPISKVHAYLINVCCFLLWYRKWPTYYYLQFAIPMCASAFYYSWIRLCSCGISKVHLRLHIVPYLLVSQPTLIQIIHSYSEGQ